MLDREELEELRKKVIAEIRSGRDMVNTDLSAYTDRAVAEAAEAWSGPDAADLALSTDSINRGDPTMVIGLIQDLLELVRRERAANAVLVARIEQLN